MGDRTDEDGGVGDDPDPLGDRSGKGRVPGPDSDPLADRTDEDHDPGPDPDPLADRVIAHFTDEGDRDDVWAGFARFLDTRAYLNLGYSRWYQPHPIGDSQRRLAARVGRDLSARLNRTDGVRLLDVGCGRGGPARHWATEFGFDVTGVDLVPYNVRTARRNARERGIDAEFLLGDATTLPVATGVFPIAVSLDALVYVPQKAAAFGELARVLGPQGHLVVADLVAADGVDADGREALSTFADAWDMAVPSSMADYRDAIERAGLSIRTIEDVSGASVARFRKWSTLYLALASGLTAGPMGWLHRRLGLDPAAVREQVRAAHDALPFLRRILVSARRGEGGHHECE
jgi:SAM-dependent methyltransferase